MARLTKIDKMTAEERSFKIKEFQQAPYESHFPPEVLSLVYNISLAWLQKKRCDGGGIPFSKPTARTILYKKADVLDYMERQKLLHTA